MVAYKHYSKTLFSYHKANAKPDMDIVNSNIFFDLTNWGSQLMNGFVCWRGGWEKILMSMDILIEAQGHCSRCVWTCDIHLCNTMCKECFCLDQVLTLFLWVPRASIHVCEHNGITFWHSREIQSYLGFSLQRHAPDLICIASQNAFDDDAPIQKVAKCFCINK